MGKIRIKTLGDEEQEKKQKREAQKRSEAKKAQKEFAEPTGEKTSEKKVAAQSAAGQQVKPAKSETKEEKKQKKVSAKKQKHSKKYLAVAAVIDKSKQYPLDEAVRLLPKVKRAKFDETVELHINTTDKGIAGSVILPHGTGKQTRIAIANQSEDPKGVEALVKQIESGKIDFDVVIATPD